MYGQENCNDGSVSPHGQPANHQIENLYSVYGAYNPNQSPTDQTNNYLQSGDYQIIKHGGDEGAGKRDHDSLDSSFSEEEEGRNEDEVSINCDGVKTIPYGTIKIERKLGNGAFGVVHKGDWQGIEVAMKTINVNEVRKNFSLNIKSIEQSIEWEVSRISSVSNPGVVQFFGLYQEKKGASFYIIMEFCSNGTLQDYILKNTSSISWDQKIQWSLEIAQGLNYLHKQGIIHRDLKAENVLLTSTYSAKLADLGVAQVDPLIEENQATVVTSGLQDRRFVAPEIILLHQKCSLKTDIYAFGLICWQIAAGGVNPPKPENSHEFFISRETSLALVPGIPSEYAHVINGCVKFDSLERFDVLKVIERLEGLSKFKLLNICRKVEDMCYSRYLEGLFFISPYVSKHYVTYFDEYWKNIEFFHWISPKKEYYEKHFFSEELEKLEWENRFQQNPPMSLDQVLFDFLSSQDTTLALFGDAGTGKSLSTHLLAYKLIQGWKLMLSKNETVQIEDIYFPLFIRPTMKVWSKEHLVDSFIGSLKYYGLESWATKLNFLIILDGYDELVNLNEDLNIGDMLNISESIRVKLLITCRPNIIQNIKRAFEFRKSLVAYYFLPFNILQLLKYLQNHKNWNENEFSDYKNKMQQYDQLRIVLRNPFVLKLVSECWDEVISPVKNFNLINRFGIYNGYIKNWLKSKVGLLSSEMKENLKNDMAITKSFHWWASTIAIESFLKNDIRIQKHLFTSSWDKLNEMLTTISKKEFSERKHSTLLLEDYLSIKHSKLQQFLNSCPIQERNENYEFIHKSFFEFYCAKYLLLSNNVGGTEKLKYLLSKRLIHNNKEMMKFWIQGFNHKKKSLVNNLFNLIKESRNSDSLNHFVSANASSLLASAKVSFSGMDLSFINITGAHMFNSICYKTNFSNATLVNVNFSKSNLTKTNFTSANLEGSEVGLGTPLVSKDDHGSVLSVAFHPNGKLIASGYSDSTIQFWDINSHQSLGKLQGHSGSVWSVVFNPDGTKMASGSHDKTIKIWDTESHKLLEEFTADDVSRSVVFSPDGKTLASGLANGTIQFWDLNMKKLFGEIKGHAACIWSVVFNPNGKILASGSSDQSIKLWNVESQKLEAEMKQNNGFVTSLVFSPDGSTLVSGCDEIITLWDMESHKSLGDLKGHSAGVNSVALSPDGKMLTSGSDDGTIKIWDVEIQQLLGELQGHTGFVNSVVFSPDGKVLASGSNDKSIKLWETESQKSLEEQKGHNSCVRSLSFSLDGKTLASSSDDKTIQLWDVENHRFLGGLKKHTDVIRTVTFSPDGKTLASGSDDNTVLLWSIDSQQLLGELTGHDSLVRSISFSPDGKTLASGSSDKTIKLWDLESKISVRDLNGHDGYVSCVVFSPDGKLLASGSNDKIIRLWDLGSLSWEVLEGHNDTVWSIVFSPDGKTLASAGDDKVIKLWDIKSKKVQGELKGHEGCIRSIAFGPDGKLVASGSDDGTIKLWDVEKYELLETLTAHGGSVMCVALSSDGILASGGYDNTIQLWEIGKNSLQECSDKKLEPTLVHVFSKTGLLCLNQVVLENANITNSTFILSNTSTPWEGGDPFEFYM